LIQSRIREDGETLNPESISVLVPACGSGHILVAAYDVLKAIYLERGYQSRAIPRLILERNLFGLDIDDRAGQLAAFALLMKARADNRRLFEDPPKVNVFSLQQSKGMDASDMTTHLAPFGLQRSQVEELLDCFGHAKTFGSLITIPPKLRAQLKSMVDGLKVALRDGDLYARQAANDLFPLIRQGQLLAMQFDAVVANPPYMGSKSFDAALKDYVSDNYPDSKFDLFAMFMEKGFAWCKPLGFNSMVTMQSWMFLSSYETMRQKLLRERTLQTMAHLGPRAFGEISGEVVQTTASVFQRQHLSDFRPVFFRLVEGQESDKQVSLRRGSHRFDTARQSAFDKIPGSPVAYWASSALRATFMAHKTLSEVARPREGLNTTDNDRFLRRWWECSMASTKFDARSAQDLMSSGAKWVP
jgi:type II restriction/modification system DNA methylase subunit YeeA